MKFVSHLFVAFVLCFAAQAFAGDTDPLFVNATDIDGADNIHRTADDGLRLVYGSPALNTGTTIGAPTTDILGTARPQGAGIDMGAYENQSPLPVIFYSANQYL